MQDFNFTSIPMADKAKDQSLQFKKPEVAYNLMKAAELIKASIETAIENGRFDTTVRIPEVLDVDVQNGIVALLHTKGYRTYVKISEGVISEQLVFYPRTYFSIFWG